MGLVKQSFLRWMHMEREHTRLENYAYYERYYNGDHDVVVPPKVAEALGSELGTVLNYCPMVVSASVDYIAGGEVGVECPNSPEGEEFLNGVYDENGLLTEEMLKLLTVMGKKGDVFLKLYIEDGEIKVRVLRPDIAFPRYKTDDYGELMYCAVKWHEEDPQNPAQEKWKAQVFFPDTVDYYELGESKETQYSQWEFVKSEENELGFIPIIHIKNTVDDLEYGVSDLQVMTSLQDAIDKTITDMVLAGDQTAFQRLWAFGVQTPKGQEISMEPGMVTEVPTPEGHLDIVPGASMGPFVEALREIVDQLITVTQISKVSIMMPDAPLPASGFALRMHYIPLERKCGAKITILVRRLKELNQMIFKAARLLGKSDFVGQKTDIHFSGGLPTDEQMQMQIDEMELRNKVKSRRTIMEERGVEDVEAELERIREEEEEDMERMLKFEDSKLALEARHAPKSPR